MQSNQRCNCQDKSIVTHICLNSKCELPRLICRGCRWDHRNHEAKIKDFNTWKEQLTNDCVIQRMNHIRSNQLQLQYIDDYFKIISIDLLQILKKKCEDLKKKIVQEKQNKIIKLSDSMQKFAQNQFDRNIIETIVKEFNVEDIHQKLDEFEENAVLDTKATLHQLTALIDETNRLFHYCSFEKNQELLRIKKCIQDKLTSFDKNQKLIKIISEEALIKDKALPYSFSRQIERQQNQEEEKDPQQFFVNLRSQNQNSSRQDKFKNLNLTLNQIIDEDNHQNIKSCRQSFYQKKEEKEQYQFKPLISSRNQQQKMFQDEAVPSIYDYNQLVVEFSHQRQQTEAVNQVQPSSASKNYLNNLQKYYQQRAELLRKKDDPDSKILAHSFCFDKKI